MKQTIEQAARWNLAVGAHPSYPDRANFGRAELKLDPAALADAVFEQVGLLALIAEQCGIKVSHVKPHGALYNQAARDPATARAIAEGVGRWSRNVVMVGLAGSAALTVFADAGFAIAAEAFADRRYEPDGRLRSRRFADALITDPAAAARQALSLSNGTVTASDGSTSLESVERHRHRLRRVANRYQSRHDLHPRGHLRRPRDCHRNCLHPASCRRGFAPSSVIGGLQGSHAADNM
jgi:UPF0271 protein